MSIALGFPIIHRVWDIKTKECLEDNYSFYSIKEINFDIPYNLVVKMCTERLFSDEHAKTSKRIEEILKREK